MSKILLLGDTNIEHFSKRLFEIEEHKVINAGIKNIGVGKYQKVFFNKICNKVPDADYIILQIGLTNLLKPKCDKDNLTKINEIIIKLKQFIYKLSKINAKLIVLPLYPTQNEILNKSIIEFNDKLAQECFEREVEFLDVYELLLDNNELLKSTYTSNGFSLNEAGESLIANQINEFIRLYENSYLK